MAVKIPREGRKGKLEGKWKCPSCPKEVLFQYFFFLVDKKVVKIKQTKIKKEQTEKPMP